MTKITVISNYSDTTYATYMTDTLKVSKFSPR